MFLSRCDNENCRRMLVETTGQDEVQLEKSQELARLAATKCVLMAGGN